jgi:hypothetical protein
MVLLSAIIGGALAAVLFIPANIVATRIQRDAELYKKPFWPFGYAIFLYVAGLGLSQYLMLR